MVDSQQSVITRHQFSSLNTTTSTIKGAERTTYQLQPETLHLNHSGMLPAAALSNFFKAPASQIHSKLPALNVSVKGPVIHSTKSIHQRNKCLAEVIQTQLMELKKLQDRCRYQKNSEVKLCKARKDSVDESSCNLTKSGTSSAVTKQPYKTSQKNENKTPQINTTPQIKLLSSRKPTKPTTLAKDKTSLQIVRSSTKISLTSSPKITQSLTRENTTPQGLPALERNDTTNDEKKAATFLRGSTFHKEATIFGTDMELGSHLTMEPTKFAIVSNWVKSVETAHRLEGKWSEVISSP